VDIKPLITLGGVLIAAMTSEFNDQVTVIALTDIRGALGISRDSATWIESLYVSAEIVGMAISPWMAMTFTLWHSTLFAIVLCCTSSVLIRSAQTSRRYMLCGCCRVGWRHDYPSADETAFSRSHAEHSALRPGRLRFEHNLHARLGRDRGGTLDGFRGLAVRIPADYPALPAGRHSHLVSIYG
jgi:hypothetical protein